MTGQVVALKTSCWDHFRWAPVLYPALKNGTCVIDQSLLDSRVSAIAKASFIMLVASIAVSFVSPIASLVLISLAVVSQALPYLDSWVAERAADAKAVNEYLQMEHPTKAAADRISYHISAAKLLVKRKGDPNKTCESGYGLASYGYNLNFDVFKCLVDGGIDLCKADKAGLSLFRRLVGFKEPKYLQYVLEQKKVKVADFTPEQQFDLWIYISSEQVGTLLYQYGFKVDSRDADGHTPLLYLSRFSDNGSKLNIMRVKTLLQCGANKSLTVDVETSTPKGQVQRVPKTALQLARSFEVRKLLEKK